MMNQLQGMSLTETIHFISFFKENDNPLDVVYMKQAKFDVQKPIIGSLLQQINKSKLPGY